MATKTMFADEDGNELPVLDPSSGVAQLITLLEYARRRNFQIGRVQIGDVIVEVRDLRQIAELQREGAPQESSIWKEHGYDDEGDK